MRRVLVLSLAAVLACRDRHPNRQEGIFDPSGRETAAPIEAATTQPVGEPKGLHPLRRRAGVPAIAWAWLTRGSIAAGATGNADTARGEPATAATAFEVASIAKTIVATCVMQLVEEGKLSLDGDVSSYVGFTVRHPRSRTPVTLRHLLTHTASIADRDESRASGGVALGDHLQSYFGDAGARGVFLDAGPGTASSYSNVGVALAALAVEHVSGMRFADRARERVFAPLGMKTTAFGRNALPRDAKVALPYGDSPGSFAPLPFPSHALYPVVDLFSSASDLARFGRAILRRGELDGVRVLAPASVDTMLSVSLPDAAPDEALGWQVRTIGGRRVVGHEGEDAGASTGLYLDLASNTGAIVLANGAAFESGDKGRAEAVGELLEALLAEATTTLRSQDAD